MEQEGRRAVDALVKGRLLCRRRYGLLGRSMLVKRIDRQGRRLVGTKPLVGKTLGRRRLEWRKRSEQRLLTYIVWLEAATASSFNRIEIPNTMIVSRKGVCFATDGLAICSGRASTHSATFAHSRRAN